ncbi:Phenylacetic acid catabolic protein [Desertibacillus haloalkaliphilus]|uniref:Phenylacetic acid catabolic protein n=1 Tax=Desertibacillus haloalkaliphilus TaxID=1328930 RepID=UPI001C26A583|nr:Phenylacetic acid catabolic protein [Desertibacillus haloalkaliphilus]MBU8908225.1 phenylacetate-CoA oxygenase subunit PaaI [Desertibacillus haloalkaliphilus]
MSNSALIQLVETIADNKYVLGDRLVEVGFSGPDVESTLASVAMAQGELGHARLLYNWGFTLNGIKGKKPEITNETGKSFSEVRAIDGWVKLIANLYTVNVAMDVVMEAMMDSGDADIAANINKLYLEHKEHCVFSEGWALKLINDEGGVPKKFKEDLNQALPEVEQWIKDVESNSELSNFVVQNNLVKRFQETIEQVKGEGAVTNVG